MAKPFHTVEVESEVVIVLTDRRLAAAHRAFDAAWAYTHRDGEDRTDLLVKNYADLIHSITSKVDDQA